MAATEEQERFLADPLAFLKKEAKEYLEASPANRPPSFGGDAIFDEPLLGFADGDDPIFQSYKTIVGDSHITPGEALERHLRAAGVGNERRPPRVSVISVVFPITHGTRLGLREETLVTSLRWNHTRWLGQKLVEEVMRHIASVVERMGYRAVVPGLADFYKTTDSPTGMVSNWSERHVAYAAGLGTFSLSDGLITPKGVAVRCASVVTDALLPASPRTYPNHMANCLFYKDRSCRRCIERCPAGAITEQGHDRLRCRDFLFKEQRDIMKSMGREEGYIGTYMGCVASV